jgi:hypothetical protein
MRSWDRSENKNVSFQKVMGFSSEKLIIRSAPCLQVKVYLHRGAKRITNIPSDHYICDQESGYTTGRMPSKEDRKIGKILPEPVACLADVFDLCPARLFRLIKGEFM